MADYHSDQVLWQTQCQTPAKDLLLKVKRRSFTNHILHNLFCEKKKKKKTKAKLKHNKLYDVTFTRPVNHLPMKPNCSCSKIGSIVYHTNVFVYCACLCASLIVCLFTFVSVTFVQLPFYLMALHRQLQLLSECSYSFVHDQQFLLSEQHHMCPEKIKEWPPFNGTKRKNALPAQGMRRKMQWKRWPIRLTK